MNVQGLPSPALSFAHIPPFPPPEHLLLVSPSVLCLCDSKVSGAGRALCPKPVLETASLPSPLVQLRMAPRRASGLEIQSLPLGVVRPQRLKNRAGRRNLKGVSGAFHGGLGRAALGGPRQQAGGSLLPSWQPRGHRPWEPRMGLRLGRTGEGAALEATAFPVVTPHCMRLCAACPRLHRTRSVRSSHLAPR